MSTSLTPALYGQIKSIYGQKNSLLRFRVLRLQRELREAKETLGGVDCATNDSHLTLLKLKHDHINAPAGSAQDIVKHNRHMSQVRSRLIELSQLRQDIEKSITELEVAIPQCNKMEAKNNIRCDYLAELVSEPEDSAS